MGYKRNIGHGDVLGYGAIFMSNTGTKKECFQRKLFGLPLAQSNFVLNVKKGMYLFLFEFERRQLHGVFRATANGEIDIEPNAFKSSGKHFPAQVPFTSVWNCNPLAEHEFKDAIRDNYFSWKKFKFGLSKDQVYELMALFRSKRISKNDPPKTCLRYYDDKPSERDTRFGDKYRKTFRDRNGHGVDIDEVKNVDDQDYRVLRKERSQKHNKEMFLTKRTKESDDYSDCGFRKLDKHLSRSLGGSRRVSDASLHFSFEINNANEMHDNFYDINGKTNLEKIRGEHDTLRFCKVNKNKYFRDGIRVKDEYHDRNGFTQSHSALNNLGSPDRSQTVADGWFFRHGTVESQHRTLTDHTLSKPKGITTDVYRNHKYEPRTSPFEPRGADFGIKFCSDEEFDLGNVNQINSDFIPISENRYECGFPNSTPCDPSMVTMRTPYDPDFCNKPYDPEFCHRPSYIAPGPGSSSPIDNRPIYPSETIPYHSENKGKRTSKYVRKASVFDRLKSAPKAISHEQEQEHESDQKGLLDASVNKVMKILEKVVSSPIERSEKTQSTLKQDDGDNNNNKSVDYEVPKMEADVDINTEGIEAGPMLQETNAVDFKPHKIANENIIEELKEDTIGNKSVTDSDMGTSCKRRKLVRPDFVKKENENVENAPLKVDDGCLTKTIESAKNIQGQKGSIEVEENGNEETWLELENQWGFDDKVRVESSEYEHKMCGWIEE